MCLWTSCFFKSFFYKRTWMLHRSSYIFWLDSKYCRWNCSNIWTNTLTFIYQENVVRLVLFAVLLWPPNISFDQWFFYFSIHGEWQRNNIYLQCWSKLVALVLACAHAIACIKWIRLLCGCSNAFIYPWRCWWYYTDNITTKQISLIISNVTGETSHQLICLA